MTATRFRAQAPGKLFYSGEYAVLAGAPAVVRAIDRRAIAQASAAAGADHHLEAKGLALPAVQFRIDASGRVRFSDEAIGKNYGLFRAVLEAFLAAGYEVPDAYDWSLDTQAFFGSNGKLGFGSSAALAIALGGLLRAITGSDDLSCAYEGHKAFQAGKGSGVDLRVAEAGGVQCAYASPAQALEAVTWPAGLNGLVVDTGRPSSTPAALSRFTDRLGDEDGVFEQLQAAASACATAWLADQKQLLAATQDFADALQALDTKWALGVYSGGHAEIAALAAQLPLVYKPSGAGGGDQGVALSDDNEALAAFEQRLIAHGFATIALETEHNGLQVMTS